MNYISHQRSTQSFLRVPRWKSDPCWKPLRAIVSPFLGISMARPSLFCVASQCSSHVKRPGGPFAGALPKQVPRPLGNANTCRADTQVRDQSNAFACVSKPKKLAPSKVWQSPEPLDVRCVFPLRFSLLWPLLRNAARTKHSARSPRSWAGATPRITLGTDTCTKVGSLQPNPVFCSRPN